MRLIDADKLCINFNDWSLAESPNDKTGHEPIEYTSHDMQLMIYKTIGEAMNAIDEEPTVEAIPIKWITKWLENNNIRKERKYYYYDLSVYETYEACICRMLEDWRKENEIS